MGESGGLFKISQPGYTRRSNTQAVCQVVFIGYYFHGEQDCGIAFQRNLNNVKKKRALEDL